MNKGSDMEGNESLRQLEAFVIDNPQLDELETRIAEFNIFEAMGAVRQELRHSDFLAFLLNPSQKHGLDDRFLKRFLMRVLSVADEPPVSPIRIDVADLSGASVERETQNIDILIHDGASGLVCIIENKVYTSEHGNQLARYHENVQKRFPEAHAIIPVFLTPDGMPPQDENSPYIPFSYTDVADIIDQVREAQASMLGADVNTMMRHYVTMLRRHIVSDSEIADLAQQIYRAHKAAIDLIIEHKPDLRLELAEYLGRLIGGEQSLAMVRLSKSYANFVPQAWRGMPEYNMGNGWPHSTATLSLQFSILPDQLNIYLVLGPVDQEHEYVRERIFAYARANSSVFRGCHHNLTKKWTMLYKMPFLTAKDYEDASVEDLAQIIEPKWNRFLRDVLPQLNAHLMQIEFGTAGS
jgi:hypothetical protein